MSTKHKIIISIVAIVLAYAFGYYEAPYKIKTEIKTVEVEKKTDDDKIDDKKNTHTVTTVIVDKKPDGEETTTTKTDEVANDDTKTDDKETLTDNKTTDQTKEVTKSGSTLNISAMAGVNLAGGVAPGQQVMYGGQISRNLIGPVTIGAFYLTPGVVGGSIGISF